MCLSLLGRVESDVTKLTVQRLAKLFQSGFLVSGHRLTIFLWGLWTEDRRCWDGGVGRHLEVRGWL